MGPCGVWGPAGTASPLCLCFPSLWCSSAWEHSRPGREELRSETRFETSGTPPPHCISVFSSLGPACWLWDFLRRSGQVRSLKLS